MSLDVLGTQERRQMLERRQTLADVGAVPMAPLRLVFASDRQRRGAAERGLTAPTVTAALSTTLAVLVAMLAATDAASASGQAPSISIGGSTLPDLRPSVPPSGFAGGAAGLPDAGASVDRLPPGSHGAPQPGTTGAPQAVAPVSPSNGWSEAEVRAAQVQCQRLLAGMEAQFTYVAQSKSGACGAPAPIELSGFGKGLAVSPPIVVNCDVAASLHAWMKTHVQPAAKKRLGAAIIQINTMSSYACRNRYGAKNAPLSQHAFANAIDIRGFVTAKGHLLDVEDHWGPTEKEMAAHREANPSVVPTQAAVPAGTPQAHAASTAASKPGRAVATTGTVPPIVTAAMPPAASPRPSPAPLAGQQGWATSVAKGPALMPAARGTMAETPVAAMAHPALKPSLPVFTKVHLSDASAIRVVATGQPAVLGAPSVQPGQPLDQRAHFLRDIWQTACGSFTTVLGPEANRAHRNHFHVDLAQRKSGAFCQ